LTEDIERLVGMLAATLKTDLERRGEGARTLALLLFRVDGAVSRIALGTSRPMREPMLIQKLFHERLAALEQDIDAGYGFDLVRLSVLASATFDMQQADLAGEVTDDGADIALFADRIRARLGDGAVLRPVAVESHLPERAVATIPFTDAPCRTTPPK
ncbi:DNA polymerase Y family protein, partial [Mesorhizobium sp. M7A.F.Ca.CA.001.15.1.1]